MTLMNVDGEGEGLTITSEIPESERSLALYFETRAVHQSDQTTDELLFLLRQLLQVRGVDGDVAECRCAVVLNVGVWGLEEAD